LAKLELKVPTLFSFVLFNFLFFAFKTGNSDLLNFSTACFCFYVFEISAATTVSWPLLPKLGFPLWNCWHKIFTVHMRCLLTYRYRLSTEGIMY